MLRSLTNTVLAVTSSVSELNTSRWNKHLYKSPKRKCLSDWFGLVDKALCWDGGSTFKSILVHSSLETVVYGLPPTINETTKWLTKRLPSLMQNHSGGGGNNSKVIAAWCFAPAGKRQYFCMWLNLQFSGIVFDFHPLGWENTEFTTRSVSVSGKHFWAVNTEVKEVKWKVKERK